MQKILILAPHTDDAELGCGGTIAKHVELGDEVHVIAFSRAEDSLPAGAELDLLEREMRASLATLGLGADRIAMLAFPVRRFPERRQDILDALIAARARIRPDWVLTPSGSDVHQDHGVVHTESVRAFNACSVWGYELPWNMIEARLSGYVALEQRHVESKARALLEYRSQVELRRPYFLPEFAESLARIRGLQARRPFAEAFEIIRSIA